MILFKRDGTQVQCDVDLTIPSYSDRVFYFRWNATDPIYAGLLTAAFDTAMHDALEDIRKKSYEQGWADAKAKRVKRKYFRMGWDRG